MTEDEAAAAITDALPGVTLQRIDFMRLSAERLPSDPVGAGLVFPMKIDVQLGRNDPGDLVFKVRIAVDRPDLTTSVDAAAIYAVEPSPIWDEEAVMRVFGGRVAVPAVIPFARAKIREITSDMGTLPILLGMYDPKPLQEPGVAK